MADALASGASVLIGRAGSSPAPGTVSGSRTARTGDHKLERGCDLRFSLFSCSPVYRSDGVGIADASPTMGGVVGLLGEKMSASPKMFLKPVRVRSHW